MNVKENDVLMRIIVASAGVSLLSVDKAGFLGVYVIFIALILMFYINTVSNPTDITIGALFNKTSQLISTILLLFFYIFFCIVQYKDHIIENEMPSNWYLFSYIILGILMFQGYVLRQSIVAKEPYWCAGAMALNIALFVCIVFEYITATYFRTDGFRV